jgi:twitching motility protein PilT
MARAARGGRGFRPAREGGLGADDPAAAGPAPAGARPVSQDETESIADAIVPEDRKGRFAEMGEVDFAYSLHNIGRFRVNVFRQRGSISMVLRKLRFGGPSFEEIGLPDAVRAIADEHRGLVLVTGPTGRARRRRSPP